jgi:hypothetical protein
MMIDTAAMADTPNSDVPMLDLDTKHVSFLDKLSIFDIPDFNTRWIYVSTEMNKKYICNSPLSFHINILSKLNDSEYKKLTKYDIIQMIEDPSALDIMNINEICMSTENPNKICIVMTGSCYQKLVMQSDTEASDAIKAYINQRVSVDTPVVRYELTKKLLEHTQDIMNPYTTDHIMSVVLNYDQDVINFYKSFGNQDFNDSWIYINRSMKETYLTNERGINTIKNLNANFFPQFIETG